MKEGRPQQQNRRDSDQRFPADLHLSFFFCSYLDTHDRGARIGQDAVRELH